MSGSTAIRLPILLCPNLPFHRLCLRSPPPTFWLSRPEKSGTRRNSSTSETPPQCSRPLQPNQPRSRPPRSEVTFSCIFALGICLDHRSRSVRPGSGTHFVADLGSQFGFWDLGF